MALQGVFSAEAAKLPDEKAAQLFAAVSAVDRKAVRKLLEEGVSPNVRDAGGNTPLMVAASKGNLTIAGMLLGRGADVNAVNNSGETALNSAFAVHDDVTRLLLASNADPLVVTHPRPLQRLMFTAVASGSEKAVDALLGAGVQPTVKNTNNETLLYVAAQSGDAAMVKKMIALGVSPNATTNKGFSPLRVAMGNQNPALEKEYLECIKVLVEADADPSIEVNDRTGWNDNTHTDYGYGCKLGGEIEILVNAAQKKFQVIHYAQRMQEDKVIELVSQNVKCDAVNKEGYTALHHTVRYFMSKATKALVEAGADTNRMNPQGRLPLGIAAEAGDAEAIPVLVAGGAKLDALDAEGNHALSRGLDCVNAENRSEAVQALLNAKANPDVPTGGGEYAIGIAAKKGDDVCLKFLLDAQAHLSLPQKDGLYPLHLAVLSGNVECVRLLIEAGASTFVKDLQGRTPFDYAEADKYKKEKIFDAVADRRDAELNHWAEDSVRTNNTGSGMKTLKFKPRTPA
jgi:ankyrin repeat protein